MVVWLAYPLESLSADEAQLAKAASTADLSGTEFVESDEVVFVSANALP
jgi:hypothetical protein